MNLGPIGPPGEPERLDPTPLQVLDNWWELACHLWRYEYAAEQKNLGEVADAACGLGYGTALMVKAGHRCIGLDRDRDALTVAYERYPWCGWINQDIQGFAFQRFDTLVTFETLEHLEDPWAFMKGLSGNVTTIICSAPIVPTVEHNPHHRHDFTHHGFGGLVEYGKFRIVEEHMLSAPTRKNVYCVIKGVR